MNTRYENPIFFMDVMVLAEHGPDAGREQRAHRLGPGLARQHHARRREGVNPHSYPDIYIYM